MLEYMNSYLNRLSMYKVVSLVLTGLFIASLLFSLIGLIAYSPLAMIASFVVIGLSCYLTSLLFGLLFGVRVHGESSLITSFILFFIFVPTLELSGLLTLGLVGMIAGASKFLLVYRGRHMFNPAAVAAFITSITGLAYASWWVANPPLTILILILGGVIISKTRRFLMGGIFVPTAVILVFLVLMGQGNDVGESLGLLVAWPILFFSSVMLTEPLTLPPKKWQQGFEAVVVAVLFAVPIHIGNFTTSFALALLIGNLLAFGFSRRHAVTLRFKSSKQLTPSSKELTFTTSHNTAFEAGQYMELTIPHKKADMRGVRRTFSITSAPGDKEVKFGIKFYAPASTFKKTIQSLPAGAIVRTTGVSGGFTLPKDPTRPLLFIAGGIGITPFIGYLRHLKKAEQKRNIILFYAVSSVDELAYADVLKGAGLKVFVITLDTKKLPSNEWVRSIESRIGEDMLREQVQDIHDRSIYISGPPLMIDSTLMHLKHLKVKRSHVKTDYFIGY